MAFENFNYLLMFLVVAREQSFTRAAAQLGMSRPALSRTISVLESRLGLRLLTRTTRSVSLTEAGERVLQAVGPRIEDMETELGALNELRDTPRGRLRISASDHAANAILWPRIEMFLQDYPDITVEIGIDHGQTDIVSERYDFGIRPGEQIAQDMIAVRIAPDIRMTVVGSPPYLSARGVPQIPADLANHDCINLRQPADGGLLPWVLRGAQGDVRLRVNGQLIFNGTYQVLGAVLDGFGLAYLPEDMVRPHVEAGRLQWVMQDWYPVHQGYHLYYPNRRQTSTAMSLLVDALRLKTH